MKAPILYEDILEVEWADPSKPETGVPRELRPKLVERWDGDYAPDEVALGGQAALYISASAASVGRRQFLLVALASEATTFAMVWGGTDAIKIRSLCVETSDGYQSNTPLTIQNPVAGRYCFFQAELETDTFVFPVGTPSSESLP